MKRPLRAFTLVEMIISIALFSFVMTIAAAAYLNLINLDRQTRANNDLDTNLSFVADTMTRLIRTGYTYQCGVGTNCPTTPGNSFSFVTSETPPRTITYSLSGTSIQECVGGSGCTIITDPRIIISSLNFYVTGVGNGDNLQPQVVIVIHGKVRADPSHITEFTLQTSATQRVIEI